MSALDPSYIRSIRDGIINGNIEANNQEALPAGLVGLYDKELFPPTMKWRERKETLYFFLVFAIAQKEISADFASAILGDEWFNLHNDDESKEEKRLQKVNDLIQLHSKRLSSAGSGKYRLYHERFRLYILQKVSEQDIAQFNDNFIELCKSALQTISEIEIPEKESYALEFISTHFFISAMEGESECLNKEQAAALKKHAYDQQFWECQIKASKGFEWSKRMLNQMMSVASKFNEDDEVIECSLNKVDLYHQEQNDAPRIVQLVADGDIETALERIEKFGDKDKEGLQRKFILYMLCLMELTLLDSKNEVHVKTSVEKLLKHFGENIPANQPDLINWNDFFPSYLMFQMASVWCNMNLDVKVITDRSSSFDYDWIASNGPYDKYKVELLLNLSNRCNSVIAAITESGIINKDFDTAVELIETVRHPISQSHLFARLSTALKGTENTKWDSNNFMDIATDLASEIEIRPEKSIAFAKLATECYKQVEYYKMGQSIEQSLNIARSIERKESQCQTLSLISLELVKQNNYSKANEILEEGITLSSGNSEWSKKIKEIFSNFVEVELKINKTFSSTLDSARNIQEKTSKAQSLAAISTGLFKGSFISDSEKILSEAIYIAEQIEDYFVRDLALKSIAIELCIQGRLESAIDIRNKLGHWVVEKMFLKELIAKLIELNYLSQARLILNEYGARLDGSSLFIKGICAKEIINKNTEAVISIFMDSLKKLNYFLLIRSDNDSRMFFPQEHSKSRVLTLLSSDLAKIGKFDSAQKMIDAVVYEKEKGRAIQAVAVHLAECGHLLKAVELLKKLKSEIHKNKVAPATFKIFEIFYRRVDLKTLLESIFSILDVNQKSYFLKKVKDKIWENGTIEDIEAFKKELSSDEKDVFRPKISEMQILKYVEEGNYIDALQRIEAIEEDSAKISLSFSLASKCIQLGKVDFSIDLAVNALKKELNQTEFLFSALSLANKFKEVNLPAYSYQLILLIKKKFDHIDNIRDQNELIFETCAQLINLKRADEALNDLNMIKDLQSHSYLLTKIVHQLISINDKQRAQYLIEKTINLLKEEKLDSIDVFNREHVHQNSMENKIHLFELTTKLDYVELSDKIFATILKALNKNANDYTYHYDNQVIRLVTAILNAGDLTKLLPFIEDDSIYRSSKIIQACALFGKYKLAEQISSQLKLSQSEIISSWQEIGKLTIEKMGYENAYKLSNELESKDIKKSFKLGIIYHFYGNVSNTYLSSKEIAYIKKETIALILKDKLMTSKEFNYILKLYAVNQIFLSNLPQEKLNRYNRTLNLQWAIDIKNQLPI